MTAVYEVSPTARVCGRLSPAARARYFGLGDGPMHGVRDQADLQAMRDQLAGRGSNPQRGYAHVDGGQLVIDWPFHDHGGWGDAAPRNHADMLTAFGIDARAPFYPTLLGILGLDPKTPITRGWRVNTSYGGGGGFDLGNALRQVGNVVSTVMPGILPGSNVLAALVTGKDPIAAAKQDLQNFSNDADLAKAVVSGNWPAVGANLAAKAQQLGIKLPAAAVQAAVAVAQHGGSPTDIASAAMGPGAWNAATNFGSILVPGLPPPPGLAYKPGAKAAPPTPEAHPVVVAVRKRIQLHLGAPAAAALKAAPQAAVKAQLSGSAVTPAYGPYPKLAGAVHGLGLGRPHGGHGGRPHTPPVRNGRPMRRGFGWNADGTWWYPWPYEPADASSCTAWGEPVEMSPPMQTVGEVQLRNSGGRPAAVRCADGTVYRFAVESGELTMRPCAPPSSTLGAAGDPLYFLYRSTVPVGGWAIIGGWMPIDEAQDQMTSVLKSSPRAQLGAYVWDGQSMRWQAFA